MSFDNVVFPTIENYGTSVNVTHRTNVVRLRSGATQQVSRSSSHLYSFQVDLSDRRLTTVADVRRFLIARRGAVRGFRYDFFMDRTTNADGRTAPTNADQQIGVGDGVVTQFQIVKEYGDSENTVVKRITKPVASSVLVSVDSVDQTSGWSVDDLTGVVTFTSAPAEGDIIRVGCEFHIPVRFSAETDRLYSQIVEGVDLVNSSVGMEEILEHDAWPGQRFVGGYYESTITADTSINLLRGSLQRFSASSSGLRLLLPESTSIPAGHFLLTIMVTGSHAISVCDSAGTEIMPVSPNTLAYCHLAKVDASNLEWILSS